MALGDAKSGRDVDLTLRPHSGLAFRRPGRQTHGVHRTQGIIFADGSKTPYVGGKVSQVVHLDEVEVVLTPYQIRPLIGPFNPVLISLLTAISEGSIVDFFSTLIGHQFP